MVFAPSAGLIFVAIALGELENHVTADHHKDYHWGPERIDQQSRPIRAPACIWNDQLQPELGGDFQKVEPSGERLQSRGRNDIEAARDHGQALKEAHEQFDLASRAPARPETLNATNQPTQSARSPLAGINE